MRIPTKELLGVLAICLTACMAGCGGSSPACGSSLSAQQSGPGGLTVALSGIGNGSAVPCFGLASGSTCDFTANFTVSNLTETANAQLAVEICTDADGKSFASENPGQFPVFIQPGQIGLTPGSTGGALSGVLGPPVSSSVRFALQVNLLNSGGQTIAVSDKVVNLSPE